MSSTTRSRAVFTALTDSSELVAWAARHDAVTLDLGAGDGRFARAWALAQPTSAVIAVDTCADNARSLLRRAPGNLRFVVADACALPADFLALADEVAINFPWGRLMRALLDPGAHLAGALGQHRYTLRVNAGAFAEAGYAYDAGVERLMVNLAGSGDRLQVRHLDRNDLRQIPTTWARRLAFGRDPRAVELRSSCVAVSHAAG
jgi:hypothetical protein